MKPLRTMLALLLVISLPATLKADAFHVGEVLHYRIELGALTAGSAEMKVTGVRNFNGSRVLEFVSTARSAAWVSAFFPVRDEIRSYWDPHLRRTVYNEKNLNEGNYRRRYAATFDHSTNTATWTEREFSGNRPRGTKNSHQPPARWREKEGVTNGLPLQFQDALSAVYFTRSDPRQGEPGQAFDLPVYDELKMTFMRMLIHERETITLEVNDEEREFNALRVEPFLNTTGVFRRSKGNLMVWISDDERRLPLRITASVPLAGDVTVELDAMTE